MTNDFLEDFGVLSIQPYKEIGMESQDNPAAVQECNLVAGSNQYSTQLHRQWQAQHSMSVCVGTWLGGGATAAGRAGPSMQRPFAPTNTVITSSGNHRAHSASPSYKGWAIMHGRQAYPTSASSNILLPAHPSNPLSSISPHFSTEYVTSDNFRLDNNGNNMQSVRISLGLGLNIGDYAIKGIYNDICLMSNVSVILCVPQSFKYNYCYFDINTVTELVQRNTKDFGASERVFYENQSQCYIKILDNNLYSINVKYILENQIIGDMSNYCIPLKINAITVQGISYGPHSISFNFNDKEKAAYEPYYANKSDYAFKTSICIITNESMLESAYLYATRILGVLKSDNVTENRETTVSFEINEKSITMMNTINDLKNEENSLFDNEENMNKETVKVLEYESCFKNGDLSFDAMLKAKAEESRHVKAMIAAGALLDTWSSPRAMRLRGGGETSLNAGWGSPPSSNNNGAVNPQGGSGAGSNSPGNGPNGTLNASNGSNGTTTPGGTITPSTKNQIEQLNSMREALFSQDGWGGQHVNQDTNWDVPGSPEPGAKVDPAGGPPIFKPNINNGTDLWEANLRNGGQPPPQPVSKTPWGHTPTTNIGGTWGEDDDAAESASVWSGPPPPQQQWGAAPPQQQQQQQQPPPWVGKKDDWGAWGEPNRPDILRPEGHRVTDMGRAPIPDPRDLRMLGVDGRNEMRGDPRGISGRLNGSAEMWNQHHMQHGMQPNKMMPGNGGAGQWGMHGGPKDIGMPKGSGAWEEPSPPSQRRNVPGFDDGTSLWGQQRTNTGVPAWKEGSMARSSAQMQPGMPPGRMLSANPAMKPDAMWQQPQRNGSWDDGSSHAGNWEKESVGGWPDGSANPTSGWAGPKPKSMGPGGSWDTDVGDWCGSKTPSGPPGKLLTKDMVWNSKQFRLLVDMGYKKDDVELALRSRDMNPEDALDLLSQMRGGGAMDTWRRQEAEHSGMDHGSGFQHPRPHHPGFGPQQPPTGSFQGAPGSLASITNITPALVQKIFNQPTNQPPPPFNQANQSGNSSQPSTQQLRTLVQQIQMAVSAGYLNHQILNQPLAPQTLVLLNQLLQQIKALQQLAAQHNVVTNSLGNKANSTTMLHYSVQITKAKQQITNLQNQIAAQQAAYVKQQSGGGGGGSAPSDFFNKATPDPLSQLQNNFTELTLNKEPPAAYGAGVGAGAGVGSRQSRLNQWKLPSLDKDDVGSEFSRAPGSAKSTTSPQLNALGLQPDNTWSSGGRSSNDGWPSSVGDVGADMPDAGVLGALGAGKESWPLAQPPPTQAYSDMVPEFEPGKPWKGHQMKNIEDDPALTPGSVARSLSLAVKDTDIFGGAVGGGKASPGAGERSLSSSTWSYPPPSAAPAFKASPKAAWEGAGGELWGNSKAPPPPQAKAPWGGAAQPQRPTSFAQAPTPTPTWQSTWLLLKNLTAQIDGSTLKTLCMQHGPLQSFHLYLNQSIALARYSTREEANKAQTALNNCVLGNTTIFAESPGDSDVQMILQHLGLGAGGSAQWRGGGGGAVAQASKETTWGGAFLWGDGGGTEQRSTPSSFLPPDLLGGESM